LILHISIVLTTDIFIFISSITPCLQALSVLLVTQAMALMHNMALKIARLEELTEYQFNDQQRARESLQAAGSPLAPTSDGNKRLAMKGDAILRFLVIEDLYRANHTRGIPIRDIERRHNE